MNAAFKTTTFILVFLGLSIAINAQDAKQTPLDFQVNRILPYVSISKLDLQAAKSLSDLNKHFKPSWVSEYLSVEFSTLKDGKPVSSMCKQETLSSELHTFINNADHGAPITCEIKYMPNNTLSYNDPTSFNFTINVDPESEASFPGGELNMNQYIKTHAIDQIQNDFDRNEFAAINFTVDETGQIIDAHIFESEYNMEQNSPADQILLQAVCNMPKWLPATYPDGTKVKQKFTLAVGNLQSCLANLITY